MKRFYVVFPFLFIFVSCIMNPEYLKRNYTIVNESTKTVSFSLPAYNTESYSLARNAKLIKHIYAQPTLIFTKNYRTLYYERNPFETVIKDMPSWQLHITNRTEKKISVEEKNGDMGELDGNGDAQPITIESGATKNTTIFTQNPSFTVKGTDDSPITVITRLEFESDEKGFSLLILKKMP